MASGFGQGVVLIAVGLEGFEKVMEGFGRYFGSWRAVSVRA